MRLYETQPQLPFPAEHDPNQPELPIFSKQEIVEKADFLFETLSTIEQNLGTPEGLGDESRQELEASREYFEGQLGLVLELGAELGMFEQEGAPTDDYETVAA